MATFRALMMLAVLLRSEPAVNLLEPLGYREILWAEFLAFMALLTFVSLLIRWELAIKEPGTAVVPVHIALVVERK